MTSAWATAEASASVNFSYSLVDLLPNDGLTPFFNLSPLNSESSLTGVSVSLSAQSLIGDQGGVSETSSLAFQALSQSIGSAGNQASAATTPTSLSVSGQAMGVGQGFSAVASTGVSRGMDNGLELSPYAVLMITATVDLHAKVSATASCGDQACGAGQSDYAYPTFNMALDADNSFNNDPSGFFYSYGTGYNSQYAFGGRAANNGANYTSVLNLDTGLYETVLVPSDTSVDEHQVFTFVLTNGTASTLYASFSASVDLSGVSASLPLPGDTGVPGIPEPATWATMALGLTGIAAAARRRRRQA